MKVNLNAVNFTINQNLVDFVQKKLDKLETFYDRVIDADVFLKLNNTASKENKIAEIKINVPSNHFVVIKEAESFEEAVDMCINPIERFLEKHKEKNTRR